MFGKKIIIQKIDVQKSFKLTQEYTVTGLATLIIADKRLSVNIIEEDIIDLILYDFISSVKI